MDGVDRLGCPSSLPDSSGNEWAYGAPPLCQLFFANGKRRVRNEGVKKRRDYYRN